MKISYSAPAKVILSGEHVVVYGKPALVSTIDLRLKFSLFSKSSRIRFGISSNKILNQVQHDNKTEETIHFIAQKVKDYLKNQKIEFEDKPFNFKIDSHIPIGRGLGSSAALAVASTAAFLNFYTKKEADKEIINNLAYQIEKYFHQNPSGVDNSTAYFGGLIFYRKEFEFLKNISRLNFKLSKKIKERLFLIDSSKPKETTAQMVNLVGKFYNQKPKIIEKILNEIEKTTKRMVVSIVKKDAEFFKKCLTDNEKLLEDLGVVSKNTKKMLLELSKFGVGKITGAGGGKDGSGFILFFVDDKEKLARFLKRKKINHYQFVPDYQGLKKL